MYDVIKWVQASALAAAGLNEQQIDEAVKARRLPTFAESALSEARKAHFHGLNELRDNYRQLAREGNLQEVLTTSHFSSYFEDAISRAFYSDYRYQGFGWNQFITDDTTPDFRPVKRFRATEPDDLQRRGEQEQKRETNVSVGSPVTLAIDEFSRDFEVSWRAIANDDLGKIRETPQRMANAASRWLDKFVSRLYDNATTQAGLTALGTTYAGTGKLTIPNLTIGLQALKSRTDDKGYKLEFSKVWLVIPTISEITASEMLANLLAYGGTNSNNLNNYLAGVVKDPHMTATIGGNVPWYLIAGKEDAPTVSLLRSREWPKPAVFQKQSDVRVIGGSVPAAFAMGDFASGKLRYMVQDVVGGRNDATYGGLTDFRGIYWSNGSTS